MALRSETQTRFAAELRVVPTWAWVLAITAFVAAQIVFDILMRGHVNAPPAWGRALIGLAAGVGAGCWLLFIGYINCDAKRRGMSPTLWTIVAILIPNALGIILYFILRQPLRICCPQCGSPVDTGFNFCPRCSHKLSLSCPRCQRAVGAGDVYCPYCGTSLRNQGTPELPTKAPGA